MNVLINGTNQRGNTQARTITGDWYAKITLSVDVFLVFFIWWSHLLCRCLVWGLKQKYSRTKSVVHSLFSSSSACWVSVCLHARKKKVDTSLFTQGCLLNKLKRTILLPDDEIDLWSYHSFLKHYAKFGPETTGSTGWWVGSREKLSSDLLSSAPKTWSRNLTFKSVIWWRPQEGCQLSAQTSDHSHDVV